MKKINFLILLFCGNAMAQTGTIRGTVMDVESSAPLIGATVVIVASDPIKGSTTDVDGKFNLENAKVGRLDLKVTYLGYAPRILSGLMLESGKELILNVEMEERVLKKDEVVVTANRNKERALNTMSTASARVFSTEEADRFAGAMNDVARMAGNFAGVRSANDAQNDIVIRGNSPLGLLWRLEGVDIPNPNHFGDFGSTGGPVSMLNGNTLANSDFMTGAFPSEYGNALSGVFDLNMRSGNNERHEFLVMTSFNGLEAGAEGPFSKKKGSSYLINYRISTLGLFSLIGIDFGTGSAVPNFQDLSFKLRFPTKKAGIFEVFGLGGISSINLLASEEKDTTRHNLYGTTDLDVYDRTMSGTVGLTHTYILPKDAYTKFTLSASSLVNRDILDSLDASREIHPWFRKDFQNHRFQALFFYKKKFSAKHSLKTGIRSSVFYAILKDSIYDNQWNRFVTLTDFDGATGLVEPYAQWQWRWNDSWTMNTGLHGQVLTLNGTWSVEPRWGLSWKAAPKHTLSLAYGLHNQMAPIAIYFQVDEDSLGNKTMPNRNLDFTRSHHVVLGYDWSLPNSMRFRTELYYQYIFNAPIDMASSSYSTLNYGGFIAEGPQGLENGGTGMNYGAELTFEKFLTKGYYWLLSASLYESKYTASDGMERNTAFNGNYVVNALGGYELKIGKQQDWKTSNYLLFDLRFTIAGGSRYTPIDTDASALAGEAVYVNELAYSEQFEPYYRLDLRIGVKRIGKRITQEYVFDIQNVTNRQNPLYNIYDANENALVSINQMGLLPMYRYRIHF
jgi:hypothetical protein